MPLSFSAEVPTELNFQRLEQHQSSTPESFFDGPPVLYAYASSYLLTTQAGLDADAKFRSWYDGSSSSQSTSSINLEEGPKFRKGSVDVWITNASLMLTCKDNNGDSDRTITIPYQAIALHAIQRLQFMTSPNVETAGHVEGSSLRTLYLQIDMLYHQRANINDNTADIAGVFDIHIVPSDLAVDHERLNGTEVSSDHTSEPGASYDSIVSRLYEALSTCAEFWPDENEDEDDQNEPVDGGSSIPGEGGWITAENADQFGGMAIDIEEYTDADGNFRILGPGAGTRRGREGDDQSDDSIEHADGINGVGSLDTGTKWQRTS